MQRSPFQYLFLKGIQAIQTGKHFHWLPVLLFSFGIILTASAQKSEGGNWSDKKEIEIQKSDVEQLFSSAKNNTGFIGITGKQMAKSNLAYTVINNQNQGPKSGALAISIKNGESNMRLLANRKERYGKLEYWIAILPAEGDFAFKLKEGTSKTFVLERVAKSDVITE